MKRDDCTQCQEWELCPFHGDEAADTVPETERADRTTEDSMREWIEADPRCRDGLRLLGTDDPEVSDDWIYADPRTGGVVAVPRRRAP